MEQTYAYQSENPKKDHAAAFSHPWNGFLPDFPGLSPAAGFSDEFL
jgi:hypothetical protein